MHVEYIKSAISSIRNNKGRAILTMLGIIIGIAAVLTVLIIGDGMKAYAPGGRLLTDDRAPVEKLGMAVIDALTSSNGWSCMSASRHIFTGTSYL